MRHREWSPKTFFRKMSPSVIALYEAGRKIVLIADHGKTADPNQAYWAWKEMPDAQRQTMETELLPINDMCSTHARPYLDLVARLVWGENDDAHLIEESRDWSINDLAMRLFLSSPHEFHRAHQNYAVDMLDHFREFRGKYPIAVKATPDAKARMRQAMAEHFREHAGGARCQVEDFDGDSKLAVFILHEDEVKPLDQFGNGETVAPVWMRLVQSIAAVFYPETCTLLVKAPRKPEREKLRDLWAEIFVGQADYFEDLSTMPKYNFTPLFSPGFDFPTHPADGLGRPSITRVVTRTGHANVRKLTIDFAPNLRPDNVRRVLAEHRIPAAGDLTDGLRIQFEFADGVGRARFRTASLQNPNSTNLSDTKRDRIIRRYLKEWGIDESRSAFSMAAPPVKIAAGA